MATTLLSYACISGLLLSSLAMAIVAARAPFDSRFVGTWELRAFVMRTGSGVETNLWGHHPVGRLVYGPDGRMIVLVMHENRNQADGRSIPEEVASEAAGYFGTYTIDAVRAVVTHHVEGSLRASESGAIERSFEFRDGTLLLTARGMRDGSFVTYVLTWTRLEP